MKKVDRSTSVALLKPNIFLVERWYPFILIVLATIIFLPRLGEGSLRDWDEAIYAQVSREIVQSDDWITLHFGYEPFFEKPPLLMWTTAVFFKLFGVNEFWARITSVISGTLLVWLTYLTGKTIYKNFTGFLAGIILLGCYGYVFEARNGETDMSLALLIFSGIYAYLRLKNGNTKWWYLIWASSALAFMMKYWAGLMLPATIALVLFTEKQIEKIYRSKHFWLGGLLAIIIVIPWHYMNYTKSGMDFLDVYLTRNLFERSLISMETHSGTPLFYLDELRRLFSPWYFLFPFALALAIREIFKKNPKITVILIEILLVFGVYTFVVNTKNPSYIFPIFPALAILTAHLITYAVSPVNPLSLFWFVTAALFASTVIPDKLLILFILIIIVLIALLKRDVLQKNQFRLMVVYVVFTIFFLSNILSYVFGNHRIRIWPIYGLQVSPVAQIAAYANKDHSDETTPLICFALVEDWASDFAVEGPTAIFYSNRPIVKVTTWDQLTAATKNKDSSEILIARKYIPKLLDEFEVEIIEEVNPLVYARISH